MKWKRFQVDIILALVCIGIGYFMGENTRFSTAAQRAKETRASLSHSIDKLAKSSSTSQSYQELSDQLDQLRGNDRAAQSLAEVDRMDLAAVQKMTREMLEQGGNNFFSNGVNLRDLLIEKWAELDPHGLMEEGLLQNTYARDQMVGAAFGHLARIDFTSAWDQAQKLDGLNRTLAMSASIGSLAEDDPQAAISFFENNKASMERPEQILESLLGVWGSKDAGACTEYIHQLPESAEKNDLLMNALRQWSYKNPDEAISWADTLATPYDRQTALKKITSGMQYNNPQKMLELARQRPELWSDADYAIRQLARYDFDQAKSLVLSLKNPMQKSEALSALANSGSTYNAQDLLSLASTLPVNEAKSIYSSNGWWYGSMNEEQSKKWLEQIPEGPLRDQSRQQLISRLSYQDPAAAAKMFHDLPSSMKNGGYLLSQIASSYAHADPKKALDWAKDLGSFAQKKSAYSSIFANLAQTSPDTAAAEFGSITDAAVRKEITGNLASSWANSDLDAAEKWANSLPGEEKNRAISSMANALARSNPAQAQKFVEQLARQNPGDFWKSNENQQVIRSITSQVADTDPQAAAKWIEKLPPGAAQDSGYASLVRTWAVYEPDAAGSWLNQMPAGETRNQATSNYVQTIARTDPEGAYDWAVSIDDSTMRREAAKQALMSWKENGGKEQAMQSIQQNTQFTEQERAELIKAIE